MGGLGVASEATLGSGRRNWLPAWLAGDTVQGIRRQRMVLGILFLLPTLIGLILFVLGPIVVAVAMGFMKWNVFRPPEFVALKNFARLFRHDLVGNSFGNTFVMMAMTVGMLEVFAIALALSVHRFARSRLAYFFRTVWFLPVLLSGVSVAVTLSYMFHTDFGVVNYYLGVLGIDKVPWLVSSDVVRFSVSLATVWRNLGFTFIIYLGGVSALPQEILEAATVDGARGLKRLWLITLPLLSPTILFATVIDVIRLLQFFDEPYVMTRGGPGDSSRTAVMMVYDTAFANLEFGYASSISVVLFLIILAVTGFQFLLSKRWVFYQ